MTQTEPSGQGIIKVQPRILMLGEQFGVESLGRIWVEGSECFVRFFFIAGGASGPGTRTFLIQ